MTLSFATLFSDTKNFVINRIIPILITLLVLAVIAQLVTMFFVPTKEALLPLQQFLIDNGINMNNDFSLQSVEKALLKLTQQQQQEMVTLVFGYIVKLLVASLITNILSTSICLSLIANLSSYSTLNVNELISKTLMLIPQIILFILLSIPFFFVLILIATVLAPLMVFIMLFGMAIYTIIYTIFLSIIIAPVAHSSLLNKVRESFSRLKKQYKLMLPMIGVWLITLLAFGAIISTTMESNFIIEIIMSMIGLLINFFLLSYFYRLYTLTTEIKHDAGH